MQANIVEQAIQILEDCGQQQELIDLIKGRESKDDQERISEQIVKLNKVTPTGMKAYLERGR